MFVIVVGIIPVIRNVKLQRVFSLRRATPRVELEAQPFHFFRKFNSTKKIYYKRFNISIQRMQITNDILVIRHGRHFIRMIALDPRIMMGRRHAFGVSDFGFGRFGPPYQLFMAIQFIT